jgi:hypothetical protein
MKIAKKDKETLSVFNTIGSCHETNKKWTLQKDWEGTP